MRIIHTVFIITLKKLRDFKMHSKFTTLWVLRILRGLCVFFIYLENELTKQKNIIK